VTYVGRVIGNVYQAINPLYAESLLSARKALKFDGGTQVKSTPLQYYQSSWVSLSDVVYGQ
jgi:hypothetical protein